MVVPCWLENTNEYVVPCSVVWWSQEASSGWCGCWVVEHAECVCIQLWAVSPTATTAGTASAATTAATAAVTARDTPAASASARAAAAAASAWAAAAAECSASSSAAAGAATATADDAVSSDHVGGRVGEHRGAVDGADRSTAVTLRVTRRRQRWREGQWRQQWRWRQRRWRCQWVNDGESDLTRIHGTRLADDWPDPSCTVETQLLFLVNSKCN